MADSNRRSPSKQLLVFSPLAGASTGSNSPSSLAGVESYRRSVHWSVPFDLSIYIECVDSSL